RCSMLSNAPSHCFSTRARRTRPRSSQNCSPWYVTLTRFWIVPSPSANNLLTRKIVALGVLAVDVANVAIAVYVAYRARLPCAHRGRAADHHRGSQAARRGPLDGGAIRPTGQAPGNQAAVRPQPYPPGRRRTAGSGRERAAAAARRLIRAAVMRSPSKTRV